MKERDLRILREKDCGRAKNPYDVACIYLPKMDQLVLISEGTGDNLLAEDIRNGYRDYIYYTIYAIDADLVEIDGGMILLSQLFKDKYKSTKECIPEVLDTAYDESMKYIILE